MKTFDEFLKERHLTPAELEKREEIAKAIEKEHPDIPKDQKMAIATAAAKKALRKKKKKKGMEGNEENKENESM
jgi:hypothetical protein